MNHYELIIYSKQTHELFRADITIITNNEHIVWDIFSNHSVHGSSQWEIALHCNAISHWLDACPANERWRYIVTPSLIGWVHTQNNSCILYHIGVLMIHSTHISEIFSVTSFVWGKTYPDQASCGYIQSRCTCTTDTGDSTTVIPWIPQLTSNSYVQTTNMCLKKSW